MFGRFQLAGSLWLAQIGQSQVRPEIRRAKLVSPRGCGVDGCRKVPAFKKAEVFQRGKDHLHHAACLCRVDTFVRERIHSQCVQPNPSVFKLRNQLLARNASTAEFQMVESEGR